MHRPENFSTAPARSPKPAGPGAGDKTGEQAREAIGEWRWPIGAQGAEFSGVPEFIPGIPQELTDAYCADAGAGAQGDVQVDAHAHEPLVAGTGNLRHIMKTWLPPGVDVSDVSDPGSKARAAAKAQAEAAGTIRGDPGTPATPGGTPRRP